MKTIITIIITAIVTTTIIILGSTTNETKCKHYEYETIQHQNGDIFTEVYDANEVIAYFTNEEEAKQFIKC